MAIYTPRNSMQGLAAPQNTSSNWTANDIRKSDILVFRNDASQFVDTVVAPNGLQVGLLDQAFLSDLLVTGHITGSGIIYAETGFSGSLQTLVDGTDYLRAGSNVTITNNTDGSITIASSGSGSSGSRTKSVVSITGTVTPSGAPVTVTGHALDGFNSTTIDVFLNGDLLLQGTQTQVAADGTHDFYTLADSSGDGQLKFRYDVTTNDELIVITGTTGGGGGGGTTYTAGSGLSLTGTQFSVNTDSSTINKNGSGQLQVLKVPNSLSSGNGLQGGPFDGSSGVALSVKPVSGSPVTVTGAGVGMDITSVGALTLAASDEILISKGGSIGKSTVQDILNLSGGGGGSPTNAAYLVAASNTALSDERVLTAGDGIGITDNGANSTMVVTALLDSGGGLEFVTGKLAVKVADFIGFGLSQSAGNIIVNTSALAGAGLTANGNVLDVNFGTGTNQSAKGSNTIAISAGDGLGLGGTATIGTASSTINLEVTSTDIKGSGMSVSNNNLDLYIKGTNGINITTGSLDSHGTPIIIDASAVVGTNSTIGNAEDGSYTDGLFTDFTNTTPVGTAVDRFNEVLKFLSPSSAPNLVNIGETITNGVASKLSFGSSNSISSYSNVSSLDSTSAKDVNATYETTTESGNLVIGTYDKTATIEGDVNSNVSASLTVSGLTNYPAKSFGEANLGNLILNVNGTDVYTLDLTDGSTGAGVAGSGTGSHLTNNTGFYEVSAATSGKYQSGDPIDLLKHRTAKYRVAPAAQRNGWNYVIVKHVVGSTTRSTNHVQWVNDSVGATLSEAMTVSGTSISSVSLTGLKYLSGVKYYTGGSLQYNGTLNKMYTNVFSVDPITFTSSEVSSASLSVPNINTGSSEDESKSIAIAQSLSINATSLLNTAITVGVNATHPIKSNLANSGTVSLSNVLLYNISEAAAETLKTTENFAGESYRLVSGAYSNQSSISGGTYNSQTSLLTNSGLLVYDQKLVAPIQGANSGNFSTIANGPSSNVNYSGVTSGTLEYYRKFVNNTGFSQSNFQLSINGTGTIVPSTTSLSGNYFRVFVKLPSNASGGTGWLDISVPFSTGSYSDNDGSLVDTLDNSLNSIISNTFGIKYVENSEMMVIKIVADASWTGHISNLAITWG